MPPSVAPSPEDLDRLLARLRPSVVEILREWEIPEGEAEKLVSELLVRLSYRWSRIPNPEQWLLTALEKEARNHSERSRKEPRDD
ncbi:MAG TPA: hypothetical protein VGS07_19060 [Thermoanaerobaculia bacterium]|jgi:hypothetical protein|nr:hypothetical protein [Thermoanaerobaculia bacterium]